MLRNHTFELKSVPYISGDSELKQPHTYNKEPIRFFYYIAAYFDDF